MVEVEQVARRHRSAWVRSKGGFFALVGLGFVLGIGVGARGCASKPEPPASGLAGGKTPSEDDGVTIWTCAMHPQIRKKEPGQCPICGMDLIPADSHSHDEDGGQGGAGNAVVLSERARTLAELRTTTVQRRGDAAGELRLLGRIVPDETTLKTVTAWIGGRIDRLHVTVTGEKVRAGQTIATLYSPEVLSAHQDLLVAEKQLAGMTSSTNSARSAAQAALEAARERLRLLGVKGKALSRLEHSSVPTRSISIHSPFSGTVVERLATEGAYVETGAPLYRIANLNRVWVQLDAYESDLARLTMGQPVQLDVQAFPGEPLEGKVSFIDPNLDPQRRTAQVRVEVENADGRLLPGMFANAVVRTQPTDDGVGPLVVPASAPLFTGRRAIVYVEQSLGRKRGYVPRTVRLGPRLGEAYPVVAGLSEGERVVSRGAFALDADLQIRGGASMMTEPDDNSPPSTVPAAKLSTVERKTLADAVEGYLHIQQALAEDELDAAQEAARSLQHGLTEATISHSRETPPVWVELAQGLRGHAQHLVMAKDLEGARSGFEMLSATVVELLRRYGNPLDRPLHLAFCPMAQGSEGASWVQQGTKIDNAYFGPSMRSCGEIKQEVQPGDQLNAEAKKRSGRTPMQHGGHVH